MRQLRTSALALTLALGASTPGCADDPTLVLPPGEAPLGDRLPVDQQLELPGLHGWVDAVRDEHGRTHIYATDLHDAALVQGYLVARDRHIQLDFLRRIATGRLAEVLGGLDASLVRTDIAFRHIGLHRVAEEMYEQAEGEQRAMLDGYAAGVSALYAEYRDGRRPLVDGVKIYQPEHLTPWSPTDTLAVARLQTWLLSYDGDEETERTVEREALRAAFPGDDPDPALAARAGMGRDYLRFEPAVDATVVEGFDDLEPVSSPPGGERASRPDLSPRLLREVREHHAALERVRRWLAPEGSGSNGWVVGPSRSASGYPLIASDPHLSLSAPAAFWPVALHVEGEDVEPLHVSGLAFPGIPAIILGHNRHLAWGATTSNYDVTDVYAETLADPGAVVFEGAPVALETVEERIDDGRGGEIVYEVKIVPHHGPIFPVVEDGEVRAPDPEEGALSVRWTGLEPTDELGAVLDLLRARGVDEAIDALDGFDVGGQSWMLADTAGHVGWTSHVRLPVRDEAALSFDPATFEGISPATVLPGDGTAEWTGFWSDEAVPRVVDPASGYLATANADAVGVTLDGDPTDDARADGSSGYLGWDFAPGHRLGRIAERIEEHDGPLDLEAMSALQADHRSPLGADLAPALVLAIEAALAEAAEPGTHPDLAEVVDAPAFDAGRLQTLVEDLELWGQQAAYTAGSGMDPDTDEPLPITEPEARAARATLVFNAWLVRLVGRVLGDELERAGIAISTDAVDAVRHLIVTDPAELATHDPSTGDSALWDDLDTQAVETRHERMVRALLDALGELDDRPFDSWRWGAHHRVRFGAVVPVFGSLSIPRPTDSTFRDGFPRHGDLHVVDASSYDAAAPREALDFSYDSGPVQRLVAELRPGGLRVRNAIPGGAVWDRESPHFADQAEQWRRNEVHDVPFALGDVVKAAERRTSFYPPP